MGRKLYVGNLPYETGETELQELFGQFGSVDTVRIMRDIATGRARGLGFVEMTTDEEAQTAIAKPNAYQLGGRALIVNEARPKPEYAGGGFGMAGERFLADLALVVPADGGSTVALPLVNMVCSFFN